MKGLSILESVPTVGALRASLGATTDLKSRLKAASGATLKQGSRGADVKTLQEAFGRVAGTSVVADGIFGPAVKGDVVQFQRAHNLQVDGVVGRQTWATLYNTLYPSESVAVPTPGTAVGLPATAPAESEVYYGPEKPPAGGVPWWVWALGALAVVGGGGAVAARRGWVTLPGWVPSGVRGVLSPSRVAALGRVVGTQRYLPGKGWRFVSTSGYGGSR